MKTILVTGGAGFIGSNFIRTVIEQRDYEIRNLDNLTYCGNLENLLDVEDNPRYSFVQGNICDVGLVREVCKGVDFVVHFAAESHVDRSIESSEPFVHTNVVGTQVLLDVARSLPIQKFVHVSTDEVYGSLPLDRPDLKFTEDTLIQPSSPYSATKAGSDMLVRAYYCTYKMPVVITRCSNNFGPYQYPEKVIPLFITNLIQGKQVPLYGDINQASMA